MALNPEAHQTAFGDIAEAGELAAAAGALDLAVAALAMDPQPQFFGLLACFALIDAIPRPVGDLGELVFLSTTSGTSPSSPPGRLQ